MDLDGSITLPSNFKDIDTYDCTDPTACTDYVKHIYNHLRDSEVKQFPLSGTNLLPQPKFKCDDYMIKQRDLTPHMRTILIDWLVEVAEEYKLASDTLYLAVNYVDRYLSKTEEIKRNRLQLVGVASMLIASYDSYHQPICLTSPGNLKKYMPLLRMNLFTLLTTHITKRRYRIRLFTKF
jgi:cyclin A